MLLHYQPLGGATNTQQTEDPGRATVMTRLSMVVSHFSCTERRTNIQEVPTAADPDVA